MCRSAAKQECRNATAQEREIVGVQVLRSKGKKEGWRGERVCKDAMNLRR